MAASTADQIRAEVARNFETYLAELRMAGPHWERKPANSADGEAAWCARQVAEHIAAAGPMFGAGIAMTSGTAMPAQQQFSFASADEAVAATPGAHAVFADALEKVEDSHLDTEREYGPLGKATFERLLGIYASHLLDHANQLRSLREG